MEAVAAKYRVENIRFENGYMLIAINGENLSFKLSEVSSKLDQAAGSDLNRYKVSPSGYGIHWVDLDEDLFISGLLEKANRE